MAQQTHSKTSKHERQRQADAAAQRQTQHGLAASGPHADVFALQRTAGNRAVGQLLQQSMDSAPSSANGIPPTVQEVLKSGYGQPLDPDARASMEAQFGKDFSQVRVHTDKRGAESARTLNAWAYAVGTHIVFDEGQYTPHTVEGQSLLAHELTHVVQQQVTGPAVQLASKEDPLKSVLDAPGKIMGGSPDPNEATKIGQAGERWDVQDLKRKLKEAGYDEVYSKEEFGRTEISRWLEEAFPNKNKRPDLVAIDRKNYKVLVADVTASSDTLTDVKIGDLNKLPGDFEIVPESTFKGNQYRTRDLTDDLKPGRLKEAPVQMLESQKKLHIEKTVDDAKQLSRHLPDELKEFKVYAQDYHWRTGGSTKMILIKPGRGPAASGSTGGKGTAPSSGQIDAAFKEPKEVSSKSTVKLSSEAETETGLANKLSKSEVEVTVSPGLSKGERAIAERFGKEERAVAQGLNKEERAIVRGLSKEERVAERPALKGMGLKGGASPIKGTLFNIGIGIAGGLLQSWMHDEILESVKNMPPPTINRAKMWAEGGMRGRTALDILASNLPRAVEEFELSRASSSVQLLAFWYQFDKAPATERKTLVNSLEAAVYDDQSQLMKAQRNVSHALELEPQIEERVQAAAGLQKMIDNPIITSYLVTYVGLTLEELGQISSNLAWYQASYNRGVLQSLHQLERRLQEAIEGNDELLRQFELARQFGHIHQLR